MCVKLFVTIQTVNISIGRCKYSRMRATSSVYTDICGKAAPKTPRARVPAVHKVLESAKYRYTARAHARARSYRLLQARGEKNPQYTRGAHTSLKPAHHHARSCHLSLQATNMCPSPYACNTHARTHARPHTHAHTHIAW